MLYLYQLFRKLELDRFDGPAGGTNAIHREELNEAEAEYRSESGSDSEAEPDHISSFPRNARGVDAKLVSFNVFMKTKKSDKIIIFTFKGSTSST